MATELRLHPAAEEELRHAYLWYLEVDDRVAQAFTAEVDHAFEVVSEQPNRWPVLTGSIRRYVFPRFPFTLVYREQSTFIEVVAVAHQRQRPGYWRNR